jgi:ADP-dependent phosphofructokinase/glucokinase
MSNLKDAADNIKKLAAMFSGLVELGYSLENMSSIENHANELLAKRDALIADVDKAQEILAFESDKYQKVAEQTLAAQQEAKDIISEAKSQARVEAKKIVTAALDKQAEIIANHDNIMSDIAGLEAIKNDKLLELQTQEDRLENIRKEVEKLKGL